MQKAENKILYYKMAVNSIITYLAIALKFGVTTVNFEGKGEQLLRILNCFEGFSLNRILYFPLLLLFYRFVDNHINETARKSRSVICVTILFSCFIVFGSSFEALNTWELVITDDLLQVMKALLLFTGWYIFLKKTIAAVFSFFDRYFRMFSLSNHHIDRSFDAKNSDSSLLMIDSHRNDAVNFYKKHGFLIIVFALIILYIPYNLISYPGIFMGDSRFQICQAFPELHYTERFNGQINLLSEDVFITQHHPVMHTLLIHWCIVVGDYIKSFNFGIFLYSMLQETALIICVAYVVRVLFQNGKIIKFKTCIFIVIIYFFAHPLIHRYMFLLSKDIIYSTFFLLLLVFLFLLFSNSEQFCRWHIIGILFSCIGMILFRNEAQYVLLLAFLTIAITYPKFRKEAFFFSCTILLISVTLFHFIYPALGFTPGSRREMFSVPFQQTARYVKYHSNEVTEEERRAISAVLNYDSLAEDYNPNLSDPVKDKFKDQATNQDLLCYFKIWAEMLLKHPETYVQATMNNYYQYFYPGKARFSNYSYEWSSECIEKINRIISEIKKEIHIWDKSFTGRSLSDFMYISLRNFPLVSLFMTPAIYTWIVILLFSYSIYHKNIYASCLLLFPLSIIVITLLSPVNGYYGRYSYPLIVALPFLIYMSMELLTIRQASD